MEALDKLGEYLGLELRQVRKPKTKKGTCRSWRAFPRIAAATGESSFSGPNRKRKIIYLGGVPMKTARTVKAHVESLAAAALGRTRARPRNIGVGG